MSKEIRIGLAASMCAVGRGSPRRDRSEFFVPLIIVDPSKDWLGIDDIGAEASPYPLSRCAGFLCPIPSESVM